MQIYSFRARLKKQRKKKKKKAIDNLEKAEIIGFVDYILVVVTGKSITEIEDRANMFLDIVPSKIIELRLGIVTQRKLQLCSSLINPSMRFRSSH